jgi:hypothetical protein
MAAPLAAGASYVSGCSSSSSAATPSDGGGADEASVVADGGGTTPSEGGLSDGSAGLTLQWAIVNTSPAGAGPDGDGSAPVTTGEAGAEAGASEGGEGGSGEGVQSDASSGYTADDASSGDDGGGGPPPVVGVQVCIYQNTAIACQTSDQNGQFTLTGLPVRTNIAVTLNKAGYLPVLIPVQTASTDMDGRSNPIYMAPSTTDPYAPVTVDWTNKGQVNIFALGASPTGDSNFVGEPGATLSLSPAAGDGPFFLDDHNDFVPGATAFVDTLAAYYNLTPGMYTLTYADTTDDCEPILFTFAGWGYPVTTPKHTLQFPIVAGYATGVVGMLCTPNSVVVTTDGG